MAIKRIDTVERFPADGDDGRAYEIVITQQIIDAATMDNPHAEVRGLKSAHTSDGEPCNAVSDDEFKIIATGVTVTRR